MVGLGIGQLVKLVKLVKLLGLGNRSKWSSWLAWAIGQNGQVGQVCQVGSPGQLFKPSCESQIEDLEYQEAEALLNLTIPLIPWHGFS